MQDFALKVRPPWPTRGHPVFPSALPGEGHSRAGDKPAGRQRLEVTINIRTSYFQRIFLRRLPKTRPGKARSPRGESVTTLLTYRQYR